MCCWRCPSAVWVICPRVRSSPEAEDAQRSAELQAALGHLRSVRDSYWDYDWRRDNRGGGRYPEHELWEAVQAYLELLDATETAGDPPAAEDEMDLPPH